MMISVQQKKKAVHNDFCMESVVCNIQIVLLSHLTFHCLI